MILLNLIGWLLLLYGVVAIIVKFAKVKDSNGNKLNLPAGWASLIFGLVVVGILSCIVKIDAQSVGILQTPNGVNPTPLKTGWHLVAPWCKVSDMDKTVWVYTFTQSPKEGAKADEDAIESQSLDQFKIFVDISITWKIDEDQAPWIFQNISDADGGSNGRYQWIDENIIRTNTKAVVTDVIKNYNVIEAVVYKRDSCETQINIQLVKLFAKSKLELVSAKIREIHYNKDYEKAINDVQIAEKEKERLVNVTLQQQELLKQESIKKDIAIQKAEGEARALQIKGNSISSNPKIIDLEWINKWNGQLPTYMMGQGQGVMINLNKGQ